MQDIAQCSSTLGESVLHAWWHLWKSGAMYEVELAELAQALAESLGADPLEIAQKMRSASWTSAQAS